MKSQPDNASPQAQFEAAYRLMMQGNLQQALPLLDALHKQEPENADIMYLFGVAKMQFGDESGEELVQEASESLPYIEMFDFMDPLLRQQGNDSPANRALLHYSEYVKFQQTDAFILSYPKCGRTWLRLLLGKILQLHFKLPENIPLLETAELTYRLQGVPTVDITHDDYPHWIRAEEIESSKKRYASKKVVLLVRDPRDVIVSYFFQFTRRKDNMHANAESFSGDMSDFIDYPIGGLDNIVRYYNVWAKEKGEAKQFMLLSYEDLHDKTEQTLRSLLKFLGFPNVSDETLKSAVEYASFSNMRKLEENNTLKSGRLSVGNKSDPEAFKTRKGKVGGYTEYLSAEDIEKIDQRLTGLDTLYARYKKSQ